MYKAEVTITLRKSILDPKGKASLHALHNLGYSNVENVRIGKHIELDISAEDENQAHAIIKETCEKLLANPVMEDFSYTLLKQ